MAFIDYWTILNAFIFIIGIIGTLFAFKCEKKDRDNRRYESKQS